MLKDADKYKEEDRKAKEKVEAKNNLESYAYQIKTTLTDDNFKDRFTVEEKEKIEQKAHEVISWIDNEEYNELTTEDFEEKRKELEEVFNPIMSKAYSNSVANNENLNDNKSNSEPVIEEVD